MRYRLSVVAVVLSVVVLRADEKRDAEAAKQKETATANLKVAGVGTATFAGTEDLLVFTPSTEAKTKATAATLQKTYSTASKALDIGKDAPWAGKLTVVVLPDRKSFGAYVRDLERRRLDSGDASSIVVRGATPTVVQGVTLGEKPTEAQVTADTAASVATALLLTRVASASGENDTRLPQWLRTGFGRAAATRAEGPTKASVLRTKAKGLFTKGKVVAFKVADLWGETPPKDLDTLATGVVDYLAFGPDAAKFPAFVQAFRPTEENQNPTAESAVTAAGWKADVLDANWKKWLVTGK